MWLFLRIPPGLSNDDKRRTDKDLHASYTLKSVLYDTDEEEDDRA
jgi:hypothetical protein